MCVVKAQMKYTRRVLSRQHGVPSAIWAVACQIAVLTHPDLRPAVDFIVRRSPRFADKAEGLEAELHRFHDGLCEDDRMGMLAHPMIRRQSILRARADAFLSEMHLCDWVEKQNVQKGIAPVSGVLLKLCRQRLRRPAMTRKYEPQWLRRWRRRWAITFGSFQSRDTVDMIGGQKKAWF